MIDTLILAGIYVGFLLVGWRHDRRRHKQGHLPADFWRS